MENKKFKGMYVGALEQEEECLNSKLVVFEKSVKIKK